MEWEDNKLTRYAIKEAVLNHVFRVKYVDSILNRFKKDNINTVQEAIARDENFKNKKVKIIEEDNVPDWFDKNIETTTSKEVQNEMDQLIKELQK